MVDFFSKLFDTSDFPARWNCGNWTTGHGILHIVSDLSIAGAYFAIPLLLGWFALRRKDLPFLKIFWLFVAFILSCGFGHLVEAFIFWTPWYRFSGVIKAITAIVSWVTVICLFPILPRAMALPGLASINERLQREVAEREAAELAQRRLKDELELRVIERTNELAATNRALEESNLELQQFAYVASHDLQTPLRAIAGYAHFLDDEYRSQLDEDGRLYLERMVAASARMKHLIDDLLAFSRVESSSRPFERVDLNQICDGVTELLEQSIIDSGGIVGRDDLPTVTGDPAQLAQLLQNLIGNALKYRGKEAPIVHVSAAEADGEMVISVSDNGIGIAPEYHERVFEIFRRLHTQEQYPGTGIGLGVCRRIVQRHHGRIWLDSEEGKGSNFHFSLPLGEPVALDKTPAAPEGNANE
ncbi:MAG: ATP-binding protein [Verrucomicrobiota bacterium JB023]|nr:ATP-binding protein [Verrucomicrobiota bacterium JB023]